MAASGSSVAQWTWDATEVTSIRGAKKQCRASSLTLEPGCLGLRREERRAEAVSRVPLADKNHDFKSVQIPSAHSGWLSPGERSVFTAESSVPFCRGGAVNLGRRTPCRVQNDSPRLHGENFTFIFINSQVKFSIFFCYECRQTTGGWAFPVVLSPIEIIGIFISCYGFILPATLTLRWFSELPQALLLSALRREIITILGNIFKTYFDICISKYELFPWSS